MEYQSNNSSSSNGSAAVNAASDSTNRKPATAQQLIRENVQYLIQQLEAGHTEALTAFLDAMAHFHNYSLGNVLLIARQRPTATHVAGMRTWNELGRRVKRGEKGIAILAPMIGKNRKKREQENEETDSNTSALLGFRRVYVWDEAQTEGAPLPTLGETTGEVGEYHDRLREFVSSRGIALEYSEDIAPALGISYGGRIALLPGQTKAEEFAALVHETAHEFLHKAERRTATTKTVRETEAEAVAFVVAKAIGLNANTSASYIQIYHGNAELLMGAERRLFFVALISGGAIFSLMHSLLGGILLFVVGLIAAQRATKYDVEILRVLLNSTKFRRRYDPMKWQPTEIRIVRRNVQG
jgi:type IV secretory pathway TrbD component